MKIEQYNKLLEDLRQLYREGKFEDLRKKFVMSAWILTPEDRKKIESVIGRQFREPNKNEQGMIDFAKESMGAKIITDLTEH